MVNTVQEAGVAEVVAVDEDGSMKPTGVTLTARFRYDREDPAAVTVEFVYDNGTGSTWVFARDLLNRGRYEPAGRGDVRVFRHGPYVYLHLIGVDPTATNQQARDTEAVFRVRVRVVAEFLRRTVSLVPFGSEVYDIDALIHEFEERSNG